MLEYFDYNKCYANSLDFYLYYSERIHFLIFLECSELLFKKEQNSEFR